MNRRQAIALLNLIADLNIIINTPEPVPVLVPPTPQNGKKKAEADAQPAMTD